MEKAGLLIRFIAIIIDGIILAIVGGILQAILGSQGLSGLVSFLIGISYQIYFLSQNNGQTPGKMVMGIRVVSSDGGSVSVMSAGLRYIGYYINSIVLLLGWIWAIFDGEHRGWHDLIAGTRVVKA